MNYTDFLLAKEQLANAGGFTPTKLPNHLCGFQRAAWISGTDDLHDRYHCTEFEAEP